MMNWTSQSSTSWNGSSSHMIDILWFFCPLKNQKAQISLMFLLVVLNRFYIELHLFNFVFFDQHIQCSSLILVIWKKIPIRNKIFTTWSILRIDCIFHLRIFSILDSQNQNISLKAILIMDIFLIYFGIVMIIDSSNMLGLGLFESYNGLLE